MTALLTGVIYPPVRRIWTLSTTADLTRWPIDRAPLRLSQRVLRLLTTEIAGQQLATGELLHELDLVRRFDVSRSVAREALRGLEERGLVSVRHGRGAMVNPPGRWDVLDAGVLHALLDGCPDATVLAEHLECRRILEVEAAGLAAQRAGEQDLVALSAAFERMRATSRPPRTDDPPHDRYHAARAAFHETLMRATASHALLRITSRIHRALTVAPVAPPDDRRRPDELLEHERILAAVTARDPDAARAAMRAHLDGVERRLPRRPHG